MPTVKIYSTSWCAFCKAEREFLDTQGVTYEDVNVEEDQTAAEEMIKLSGQMGVPVTRIIHEGGAESLKVGFDQDWLVAELKLAPTKTA